MREGTRACLCWFMLLCGRNQCNIVKQVSSNKKEKMCYTHTMEYCLPIKRKRRVWIHDYGFIWVYIIDNDDTFLLKVSY